ncbi:MAG: hypothetical protein GY724_04125 [Actinomycetia bacterium]|nr:hypothetical protein [Actinomycetes bacterium]MCP5034196.1 hypothetical protein [Actinomycetes bacterium]
MPWWFRTVFLALLLCFLAGLLLGLGVWLWHRRKEAESYERLRLDSEAESDRLRLRISSLHSKGERVAELETEVVELTQRAERLTAIQGQLSDAQTLANRIPELERSIVDLRHRGEQADRLEVEVSKLRLQVNQPHDDDELVTLRASASRVAELEQCVASLEVAAGRAETLDAELRSVRIELEETRSRTGQLEAELLAAQDDVVRLKASPLVDQAIEPSWQQGTTQLGTPGADHRDDLKAINGIGPVMERTLNDLGIKTWEQIAAFTADDIKKVSAAILTFPGRIERDDWVGGADELLIAGHVPGEDTSGRPLTSYRRRIL